MTEPVVADPWRRVDAHGEDRILCHACGTQIGDVYRDRSKPKTEPSWWADDLAGAAVMKAAVRSKHQATAALVLHHLKTCPRSSG